ncbi:hypothetical protein JOM56_007059 [Amanita muscaria]
MAMPPELHVPALGSKDSKPTSMSCKYSIQAYRTQAKSEAQSRSSQNAMRSEEPSRDFLGLFWARTTTYDQRRAPMVWNQMIEAYFRAALPSTDSWSSSVMNVPQPASSTFTPVLAEFCDSGDVETALAWFNRLLEQQDSSPSKGPLAQGQWSDAVRPEAVVWSVMNESLTSHGMTAKLDDAFVRAWMDGAKDCVAPSFTQRVTAFAANMKRMQDLATSDAGQKLQFL